MKAVIQITYISVYVIIVKVTYGDTGDCNCGRDSSDGSDCVGCGDHGNSHGRKC